MKVTCGTKLLTIQGETGYVGTIKGVDANGEKIKHFVGGRLTSKDRALANAKAYAREYYGV